MKSISNSVLTKGVKLNDQQTLLASQIREWLNEPCDGSFLIDSLAGTGKTTTIAETLRDYSIFVCAPTHRAVNEIRKRLDCGENYATTHSLLQSQPTVNIETGEMEFILGEGREIHHSDIIIIDEASMLPRAQVKRISETYKDYKVLYLGDSNQLPPVNENLSEVFDLNHAHTGKLDKIERYTGDILEYATSILEDNFSPPNSLINPQMLRSWRSLLKTGVECKMLAYTNKTVDDWNLMARITLNGEDASYEKDWIENEEVVLKAPIKPQCIDETVRYHTNEPATIYSVVPGTHILGQKYFPIYYASLYFREMDEHLHNVRLMSTEIKDGFETWGRHIVDGVKSMKLDNPKRAWAKYYKALDDFAQVKHNYASTVHSTQGATIENVFVDTKNIAICKDRRMRKQLLYTAITRCSQSLMVNG